MLDGKVLLDGKEILVGKKLSAGAHFPVKECRPGKYCPPVMIGRVARDTALICGLLTLSAGLLMRDWSIALGVAGGGLLIALAFWAIRGSVDGWIGGRSASETPPKRARFQLVKFFTRHVMLGFAAYVMMVRLRVEPVAMLMGVSSLGAAAAVEAMRGLRWRRFP